MLPNQFKVVYNLNELWEFLIGANKMSLSVKVLRQSDTVV